MRYWLFKSDPGAFGIDDLAAAAHQTEPWDGVRNYQARNMLRDEVRLGDRVLIYHSNCAVPGVVGIAEVVREGYPDHTAFDPDDPHYDPKSRPDQPRWYMVDIRLIRRFDRVIPLAELKAEPELDGLRLIQRGNRLSIMPVSAAHAEHILALE